MSRAKNWCFTLNNYTADQEAAIAATVESGEAEYVVVGREVGESGTPHLQGFIVFQKRKRLSQVRDLLANNAHLEVARLPKEAAEYCKKDGDFKEYGSFDADTKGKRNDLEAFKEDVKAGMLKLDAIRETHSSVYARYPRFCLEYIRQYAPKKELDGHELMPWQSELKSFLDGEPDDRTIVFIVDRDGNKGKTWFAHHYCDTNDNVQVILPGKKADMAFVLDTTIRVLFVDAPRSKQGEYLQYDFLEEVKNGYVFSTKYESMVKTLQRVHLVVMMNDDPDMAKLSQDRYKIIEI